jgi:hypothetical protein
LYFWSLSTGSADAQASTFAKQDAGVIEADLRSDRFLPTFFLVKRSGDKVITLSEKKVKEERLETKRSYIINKLWKVN